MESYASAWLIHSCKRTGYFKVETKAVLCHPFLGFGNVQLPRNHALEQSLGADSQTGGRRLAEPASPLGWVPWAGMEGGEGGEGIPVLCQPRGRQAQLQGESTGQESSALIWDPQVGFTQSKLWLLVITTVVTPRLLRNKAHKLALRDGGGPTPHLGVKCGRIGTMGYRPEKQKEQSCLLRALFFSLMIGKSKACRHCGKAPTSNFTKTLYDFWYFLKGWVWLTFAAVLYLSLLHVNSSAWFRKVGPVCVIPASKSDHPGLQIQ